MKKMKIKLKTRMMKSQTVKNMKVMKACLKKRRTLIQMKDQKMMKRWVNIVSRIENQIFSIKALKSSLKLFNKTEDEHER